MWIWQRPEWPNFVVDAYAFSGRVETFFRMAERLSGQVDALSFDDHTDASVDLMLSEVLASYAIEGETLDRDSVRSSLLAHFGRVVEETGHDNEKAVGAADLMVDVRQKWNRPLSHELLGRWQSLITADQITSLLMRGAYRNDPRPMLIVSGARGNRIHYEAPPAANVPAEMEQFLDWYNDSSSDIPGPVRAAIAHVWFEKIHPFDDGNGRVGRAISDHALSQSLGRPTLACLATAINESRKPYYAGLEAIGRGRFDLSDFVDYFTSAVNRAQDIAAAEIAFVLGKTRFYDRYGERLNARQRKVTARIFREGRAGFAGGLSRKNYASIAKCSTATATRDLANLLEMGAMVSYGEGRSVRYEVSCPEPPALSELLLAIPQDDEGFNPH